MPGTSRTRSVSVTLNNVSYTEGPPPFNQPTADITLRTPDHVDFHVHTQILSQASPVFADMFSLPQPAAQSSNNLTQRRPIVDVVEDSKTLERLLRLCYPINKQRLEELDDIVPVLKAATKYEMEWPVSLLSNDLFAIAPKRPLRVWAVACQTGLEDVAYKAACAIRERAADAGKCLSELEKLLEEEGLTVLHGVEAGNYYRLREFLRVTSPTASFRLLSESLFSRTMTILSGLLTSSTQSAFSAPTAPVGFEPSPTARQPRESLSSVFSVPSTPAPDLILNCSDGRQLRAHQLIVSLQSAPLRLQVAVATEQASAESPSPNDPHTRIWSTSPPAIDLDIDSCTLIRLLGILYEGEDRLPRNLPDLATTLLAARKYEMSRVAREIEARWEEQAARSPLQAYFVALQHGLKDSVRAAARRTIEKTLAGWYVSAMENSTALAYHRLLVYYNTCARVVVGELDKAVNQVGNTGSSSSSYYSSYHSMPSQPWVNEYVQLLKTKALTEGPGRTWEVTTQDLLREACSSRYSVWPRCAEGPCQSIGNEVIRIGSFLPKAILDAIAQVELEL